MVDSRAHNPEAAGSNPAPATTRIIIKAWSERKKSYQSFRIAQETEEKYLGEPDAKVIITERSLVSQEVIPIRMPEIPLLKN